MAAAVRTGGEGLCIRDELATRGSELESLAVGVSPGGKCERSFCMKGGFQ